MLNFKPTFSLSSFTFIKRFFSSSFHSAITVLSPALLRWLIYLPTILIPVWFIQPRISHHLLFSDLKHLPAMQETQVWFLGWEDPLEKEVAIHSSTLTRKIPVTCHGTWQVSCTESEAQDIQADSLLSRWEFQGMEGLQQSPNRLPVKVWGRNYL